MGAATDPDLLPVKEQVDGSDRVLGVQLHPHRDTERRGGLIRRIVCLKAQVGRPLERVQQDLDAPPYEVVRELNDDPARLRPGEPKERARSIRHDRHLSRKQSRHPVSQVDHGAMPNPELPALEAVLHHSAHPRQAFVPAALAPPPHARSHTPPPGPGEEVGCTAARRKEHDGSSGEKRCFNTHWLVSAARIARSRRRADVRLLP